MNIPNEPEVRDPDHSRPLDVHRISNHPEVNIFVTDIYERYFRSYYDNLATSQVNHGIRKKHLKLLLLDLYVAWSGDPKLCIGVHMSKNPYSNGQVSIRGKSRYNKLNIKDTVIPIVKRLHQLEFIGFIGGKYFDNFRRTARIWAEEKLIIMFEKALFDAFDIGHDEETIVLRSKHKKPLKYDETNSTEEMRKIVDDHNEILHRTFIDIPGCDKPEVIIAPKGKRKTDREVKVRLTQDNKFVRRIFNNGSWFEGGRFAGGWWQRVGETIRAQIYLNNEKTVEIDYSAIHIILAYSQMKIDYYATTDKNPYEVVELPNIDNPEASHTEITDTEDRKRIIKSLFLLSINAENETLAFKAFTNKWDYEHYPYSNVFTHEWLKRLLDNIRTAHPAISNMIASGAGIELMNIDSDIVAYIVKRFNRRDKPILTVHDSFVVELGDDNYLQDLMIEAVKEITGVENIKMKWNDNLTTNDIQDTADGWSADVANNHIEKLLEANEKVATKGYTERWEKHKKYFQIEEWND